MYPFTYRRAHVCLCQRGRGYRRDRLTDLFGKMSIESEHFYGCSLVIEAKWVIFMIKMRRKYGDQQKNYCN